MNFSIKLVPHLKIENIQSESFKSANVRIPLVKSTEALKNPLLVLRNQGHSRQVDRLELLFYLLAISSQNLGPATRRILTQNLCQAAIRRAGNFQLQAGLHEDLILDFSQDFQDFLFDSVHLLRLLCFDPGRQVKEAFAHADEFKPGIVSLNDRVQLVAEGAILGVVVEYLVHVQILGYGRCY